MEGRHQNATRANGADRAPLSGQLASSRITHAPSITEKSPHRRQAIDYVEQRSKQKKRPVYSCTFNPISATETRDETHLEPEEQSTGLDQPGPNRHKRSVLEALHHGGAELGPVLLQELEYRLKNLSEDRNSGSGQLTRGPLVLLTQRLAYNDHFLPLSETCLDPGAKSAENGDHKGGKVSAHT